jgi:hypothetical protein
MSGKSIHRLPENQLTTQSQWGTSGGSTMHQKPTLAQIALDSFTPTLANHT